MARLTLLVAALALLLSVLGLQAELAGVVDWHTELIGQPLIAPSPPSFIDLPDDPHAALVITEKNVLAVVGGNGTLRWRQLFDEPVLRYHVHGDGRLRLRID